MKRFFSHCIFAVVLFSASVMLTGCDMDKVIQKIKDAIGKKISTQTQTATTTSTATATATVTSTQTETATTPSTGTGGGTSTGEACTITVYGSPACGYCVRAKEFLKSKGIAFVDKNVNEDKAAGAEMREKCKQAGLQGGGIPVIDVCGDVMQGFDQAKLESLLKKHGYLGGTSTQTATATKTETSTGTNACTVTVYGTSSCPWCTKAKSFLKSRGVDYIDKDIGKDSSANKELAEKLQAKGMSTSGVPVVDICGDIVLGYDEGKMDKYLRQHGLGGGSQGSDAQAENPGN